MIDATENRATRRTTMRRVRTAAVSGVAAAAMTVGLAAAPQAGAVTTIDIDWNPLYTAGTLAGLVNFVGNAAPGLSIGGGLYESGPPQSVFYSLITSVPLIGDIKLNLTALLKYLNDGSVKGLYNTIGSIPQLTCTTGNYASHCRYVLELATAEATQNLVEAYRTQTKAVTTGQTPNGYIPFEAAPNSTEARPTQTNQALAFLQNPYRPNGGFYSRFPQFAELVGVNPEMPAPGKYVSPDKKIVLNTTTIDATWAYDPNADLPEVPSLVAFANSLSAALPLNLITGALQGLVLADAAGASVTTTTLGLNLAGVLQLGPLPFVGTLPVPPGLAYYATVVGDQLPLLAPSRLPALAINALLKAVNSPYLVGNPFQDAIEPALKILVNIAYPDVVTPTEGGTYNRTFLTGGTNIPFNSVEPLTPEEKKAVPGDVWDALTAGVKAQIAKPFWGILVPNPDNPPAGAATPAAAVKAAAAAPTVPSVAPDPIPASSGPAVSAPAAPVAVPADLSQAPVSAPVAVDLPAPAEDAAPVSAPRAGAHRGSASSAGSDNSGAPKSAASTGGHRGAA